MNMGFWLLNTIIIRRLLSKNMNRYLGALFFKARFTSTRGSSRNCDSRAPTKIFKGTLENPKP